jgi:uncharacterized protein
MRPTQRPMLDLTLPSARPETNSSLPDVRSTIPWRIWDDGCVEAERRRAPMLVLVEPFWANSAQRIALRLQQDAKLESLITEQVIPVLIDPNERPDLAARWRRAAFTLTGTWGPPLFVFLTHDARPFLTYCTMNVEGDDTYPSLASLIESVAETYASDPAGFQDDVRALEGTEAPAAIANAGIDALREMLDMERGGLNELPKHSHPTLLWEMLEAKENSGLPADLEEWLLKTLNALIRGGINDQLDRGFHRCARDRGWVVPHFEKPVALNARLAAVYARAGAVFNDPAFRDVARQTAKFCEAAVRDGVDALGSDTNYYTWTSREVRTQIEPSLLQVMTLHYNIQPIDNRQALRQVVEPANLTQYSHEPIDVLKSRLVRGRTQLRTIRQRRPAPRPIALDSLDSRAETIRWLLVASRWTDSLDADGAIQALEHRIEGSGQDGRGYARPDGSLWLQDQASLLAAFVEAWRVTDDPAWLDRARDLGTTLVDTWWTPDGWRERPDSETISNDVIDDILPAALTTLADALHELGERTSASNFVGLAGETERIRRNLAATCEHWSAVLPIQAG